MFRFSHKTLIIIAGAIWFAVGTFLLTLGLRFLVDSAALKHSPLPLLNLFASWTGNHDFAAIAAIAIGLFIGFFKGRFVLSKSVDRLVARISSFPEPAPLSKIYNLPYLLLISSMICLGIAIKYFEVPYDIRGVVDVAIGAALINGSMLYFRANPKKASSEIS